MDHAKLTKARTTVVEWTNQDLKHVKTSPPFFGASSFSFFDMQTCKRCGQTFDTLEELLQHRSEHNVGEIRIDPDLPGGNAGLKV